PREKAEAPAVLAPGAIEKGGSPRSKERAGDHVTIKQMSTKHDLGSGPGSIQATQTTTGFLQQIHHTALLRSAATASDVATAVLCALLSTVTRTQACDFVSALPPSLRKLLHVCAIERRAAAEIVGREQVLRTIADRLRIELEGA